MICDQAVIRSPLIGGDPPDGDEPQFYLVLFTGILAHSELNIVFHASRRGQEQSATAAAIERWRREVPAAYRDRFRVVDAVPLGILLNEIELFVSFASPALADACRRGLKPVQIGRALIGSAGFTHIFEDCDGFVDWIAQGGGSARLTLDEYSEFERFAAAVRASAEAGSAPARDPILRAFRCADGARLSPLRVIGDILANPVGALRLLGGTLAGLLTRKAGP